MVGSAASIRVASLITPSRSGTLKSTRMKTRWLRRSTWSMSRIAGVAERSDRLADHGGHVHHAVREAPFVVVPREDFQEVAVYHLGERQIDRRGGRRAIEIDRHQLLVGACQNALQRPGGGCEHRSEEHT